MQLKILIWAYTHSYNNHAWLNGLGNLDDINISFAKHNAYIFPKCHPNSNLMKKIYVYKHVVQVLYRNMAPTFDIAESQRRERPWTIRVFLCFLGFVLLVFCLCVWLFYGKVGGPIWQMLMVLVTRYRSIQIITLSSHQQDWWKPSQNQYIKHICDHLTHFLLIIIRISVLHHGSIIKSSYHSLAILIVKQWSNDMCCMFIIFLWRSEMARLFRAIFHILLLFTLSLTCNITILLGTLQTSGIYQLCFHQYTFPLLVCLEML